MKMNLLAMCFVVGLAGCGTSPEMAGLAGSALAVAGAASGDRGAAMAAASLSSALRDQQRSVIQQQARGVVTPTPAKETTVSPAPAPVAAQLPAPVVITAPAVVATVPSAVSSYSTAKRVSSGGASSSKSNGRNCKTVKGYTKKDGTRVSGYTRCK